MVKTNLFTVEEHEANRKARAGKSGARAMLAARQASRNRPRDATTGRFVATGTASGRKARVHRMTHGGHVGKTKKNGTYASKYSRTIKTRCGEMKLHKSYRGGRTIRYYINGSGNKVYVKKGSRGIKRMGQGNLSHSPTY